MNVPKMAQEFVAIQSGRNHYLASYRKPLDVPEAPASGYVWVAMAFVFGAVLMAVWLSA